MKKPNLDTIGPGGTMSDIERVLEGYSRIRHACRVRTAVDPATGVRLSEHQANLLGHLDPVEPAMVSELAEHVGVTLSTMSLTLKRLEAAGFVRRDRDPADRRVTNVRLTDAGQRVKNTRPPLDPNRVEAMLRRLDPGRRQEALRGLAALADAADGLPAQGVHQVGASATGDDT